MAFPKVRISSYINSCNPITITTLSPVHLMSLPAILVGIIVLAIVTPLQAQPLTAGADSRFDNSLEFKRYCNNALSDVIHLICGGRISSLSVQYQDSSGTVNSRNLRRLSNDDGSIKNKLDECCRRPCGYSELKLFCYY